MDLGQAAWPFLLVVDGRTSCVVPPGPQPASGEGPVPTVSAFAAYVMPLVFTGRDKEQSRTKDVLAVAMTVSKPLLHPLLIPPNLGPVFQGLQLRWPCCLAQDLTLGVRVSLPQMASEASAGPVKLQGPCTMGHPWAASQLHILVISH